MNGMGGSFVRHPRYRWLRLLVVTASAVATTSCLLDHDSEWGTSGIVLALFVAAWVSVILSWRKDHLSLPPKVRPVVALLFMPTASIASGVCSHYLHCPPSPAKRQYLALIAAVQANDLVAARTLLAHDSNPDFVPTNPECDFGQPCTPFERPLELAVERGRLQIAEALLAHNAYPDAPFHGYVMGIGSRLSDGRSPRSIAVGEHCPLIRATCNHDLPMMRLLFRYGQYRINISEKDEALECAVQYHDADAVELLLAQGADSGT